jgi:ureidoacrylate peracid hydrolase
LTYLTELSNEDTALVIVDMQKGFIDPGGGLDRAGVSIQNQSAIVPHVRRLIELCRNAGFPILWSRQEHIANDATVRRRKIPTHHQKRGLEVCVRGTSDVDFCEGLADLVHPDDIVFTKRRSSCFYNTTLETTLRALGTQVVIVCGVNSSYCVDSTVRDAYFREFDVVIVKECIGGSFDDLHDAFLRNFDIYFGDAFTLGEFEALVAGSTPATVVTGSTS